MSLIAKEEPVEERERKLIPEDIHHGVCIGVVELGTVYDERYDKNKNEVLITWELPDELIQVGDDGTTMPMIISQKYTISLHEKSNLRKMLEAWRGKKFSFDELQGFDLKTLLNVNGMIQVIHNHNKNTGKTYANVASVIPLIRSMEKKTPVHVPVYFDFDEEMELPELPEWILNRIRESQEWELRVKGKTPKGNDEPDF